MKQYISLLAFLSFSDIFSFFYLPFEHKEKLIYINWENQKGFSLSGNQKDRGLLKYHGSFPFTPHYDYIPNFDENQTVNPWLIPNPNTSNIKSIHAKELGLIQFRKVPRYIGNPYYCVGTADIHKIGDKGALYITDYYNSTITPIICKNTRFYAPTTYQGQTLYYGFAKKENKYWIYEVCAKTKKLNWFPTEITNLDSKSYRMSVLSNTKIAGQGKINEDTVLFAFDLISKKLNTINLEKKEIENLYLPSTQFERKYEGYCSQLVSHIALNSYTQELGLIKFKNQDLVSTWDINNNKLNHEPIQVPPTFFSNSILLDNKNETGMTLHDKTKNIVYSSYVKNDNLIANQMDLKTLTQKTISLPNIYEGHFQYLSHDTKSEKIIFSFNINNKTDWYFADFSKNLMKQIHFPIDLSKNILSNQIIWEKEQLFVLSSTNDLLEIPFSTLETKKLLLPKKITYLEKISSENPGIKLWFSPKEFYLFNPSTHQFKSSPFKGISSFQTKNQYAFRFLNSNKGEVMEKLDLKQGTTFILKVPQLKSQATDLYHEYPGKFYNFYKYGAYFIGFDIDQQKIINYHIPNQKIDYQWSVNDLEIFTKQIKNQFWMWIVDKKKQNLTTLKFPNRLPKGYFDLKKYIVKQTKATVMPNQKWHKISLKNLTLNS